MATRFLFMMPLMILQKLYNWRNLTNLADICTKSKQKYVKKRNSLVQNVAFANEIVIRDLRWGLNLQISKVHLVRLTQVEI